MATYSNNVTLRVIGAVSASGNIVGTTLYTCPANRYAILNLCVSGNDTGNFTGSLCSLSVGGSLVYTLVSPSLVNSQIVEALTIYVGPGQSVTIGGNSSVVRYSISGVELGNSP